MQQEMRLSPRMIQAMEILQLPIMALQERIEAELESNPVLEMHDEGVDDEAPPAKEEEDAQRGEQDMVVKDDDKHSDDFQRLAEFVDEYGPEMDASGPPPSSPSSLERDRKLDAMANTPAHSESLNVHLLGQWAFVEVPPDVRAAGELIIENVGEDGYLRTALQEIAPQAEPPISVERLLAALPLIQMLEPVGVAARDLRECLLLQLAAQAQTGQDVMLEMDLVRNYLRDIESNRLPLIAKRTGKSLEQINRAIEQIGRLNPRPGLLVGEHSAPLITPDVIITLDDKDEIVISMPEANTPALYISRMYRKMVRDRSVDKNSRQFIQKNIRSAQWLIGAILQRQHTVRRVVEEVFKVQREFLDVGKEALKPLPMADVADKVGVHVATVSRAVAGKYVQTPRGIYPLRMFFSGGTTTAEGQDVAWDAVRLKLKELIDAEDKANPFNDDQIVEALTKAGITIARRTVAKYRDILGIAPARKRRQFGQQA